MLQPLDIVRPVDLGRVLRSGDHEPHPGQATAALQQQPIKRRLQWVRDRLEAPDRQVDVSADEGQSCQAELQTDASSPWAWTLWQAKIELPQGDLILAVRAWDEAGQTQPSEPDKIGNDKGYLCAAWHRMPVRVT
jgi:hypothetical protein